MVQSFQQPPI